MKAFCPGHITGIFSIEDSTPIKEKKGSQGIGFCVQMGATADVEISKETIIFLNGEESDAPVTRRALEILAPDTHATVKIQHDAPMGQGFGMSAAGTFAATLALAVELEIPDPKYAALRATHISEVEHHTGLGDAIAQSVGGFVHRIEPGIPPHGEYEKLKFRADEVIICVLGSPIKTSDVLAHTEKRRRIRESGHACLRDCEHGLDLASFTSASWVFARDADLATDKMKRVMKEIKGQGSMVMLGNSIFAFGDVDALEKTLEKFGQVFRTNVCQNGAMIV